MFAFSSSPNVDILNGVGVAHAINNHAVTLNSQLGLPVYISMTSHSGSVVAILMDKETALQWHAPIIPGQGTFSGHFSIGTNQTSVCLPFRDSYTILQYTAVFLLADRI